MDALRLSARGRHGRAPFCLGGAQIDPASREAAYNGRRERIQDKPLCVLMLLHRRLGQVVTRDEIIDECWDGRIVGDDVINRAISILRKLAQRAGGFRIDTIPRAGYRLVEGDGSGVRRARGASLWAWVITAALILSVLLTFFVGSRAADDDAPRVSVLPIAAISGGADAIRLGNSVERAVANALDEIGFPQAKAGQSELTVSGEVAVISGKMRVDIFVGARAGGTRMVSRTFERPTADVEDLPIEVAAGVAEMVSEITTLLSLDGDMAKPAFASRMFAIVDAAAQGDALRAHQIALGAARDYPGSAAAELVLASTYGATLEAFSVPERRSHVQLGRALLERKRAFAPRYGEFGHSWCLLRPRAWLEACERQLRESAKSPRRWNSAPQRLAELVADVGRIEEATRLARVAAASDPYNAPNIGVLLQLLEIEGRHREAEAIYATAIRKWPGRWTLRWNRIMGLAARGDFASLEHFAATIPEAEFTFDAEVLQSALAAYRNGDRRGLVRSCARENLRWSTKQVCVAALAAAEEIDASFAIAFELYPKQAGRSRAEDEELWLERPAYFALSLLSVNSGAPLRRDPRFLELAAQTGLLRYWRTASPPDFCRDAREAALCGRLLGRALSTSAR